MFYRSLKSRIHQAVILIGLLLLLATTLIGPSPTTATSIAGDPTPTPPTTTGWDDPVGG